MFCGFVTISLTKFSEEFKLVLGVVNHLLLDSAENHAVEGRKVCVIILGGFLEDLVSSLIVTEEGFLVTDFSVVCSVLR